MGDNIIRGGFLKVIDSSSDPVLFFDTANNTTIFGNDNCTLASGHDGITSFGDEAGSSLVSCARVTLMGYQAGATLSTETDSTAIGYQALSQATASFNDAYGTYACDNLTIATYCIGIGYGALRGNAVGKLQGNYNIGIGFETGRNITVGTQNHLIGYQAGASINAGVRNIAIGYQSLTSTISDNDTVAIGHLTASNMRPSSCVFIGSYSGSNSAATSGIDDNTAVGYATMQNVTSTRNVALGSKALQALTSGADNIAIGFEACNDLTTSSFNVVIGGYALDNQTTGSDDNVIIGYAAQPTAEINTSVMIGSGANSSAESPTADVVAIGYSTLSSGNRNVIVGATASNGEGTDDQVLIGDNVDGGDFCDNSIVIGSAASLNNSNSNSVVIGATASITSTASNCIVIGYGSTTATSNQIYIGNASHTTCFIRGVANTGTAANMEWNSGTGEVTYVVSSRRFKENIADLSKSEDTSSIYDLRPVTFNLISDETKTQRVGFIAEEVYDVMPSAVSMSPESLFDEDGDPNKLVPGSVNYPMLTVPIIAELQKQKKVIDKLEKQVAKLTKALANKKVKSNG